MKESSSGSSGAAGGGSAKSTENSESSSNQSSLSPDEQKFKEEEFEKISQKLAQASENLNKFVSLIDELKKVQQEQKIEESKSEVLEAKLEVQKTQNRLLAA